MKKLSLALPLLLLFACGSPDNTDSPQSQSSTCYACVGWTVVGDMNSGTVLWKSSENPLPACDATACDSNQFDCTSFISYSIVAVDSSFCL